MTSKSSKLLIYCFFFSNQIDMETNKKSNLQQTFLIAFKDLIQYFCGIVAIVLSSTNFIKRDRPFLMLAELFYITNHVIKMIYFTSIL